MKLTEQIQVKKNKQLSYLCHIAKNLYNEANYIVRQRFFKDRHWTRYYELNSLLKSSDNYNILPTNTSEQILKLLDKNWKSFFNAMKDYSLNPDKYFERPRPPKYKSKSGEFLLIFTYNQCRIKDNWLYFPKKAKISPIKTRLASQLNQVRIIPRGICYVIEIIYEKEELNFELDKDRVLGIDLGLRNLVTIVSNSGLRPFIIKGGIAKSINQFYNKQLDKYKSIKDLQGYKFETKRLQRLHLKRNNKIRDLSHKISRYVINYCIVNDIGTIIIGYNQDWKQGIHLGKKTNQNFVSIPFLKLIQMLQYKGDLVGINTRLTDESYTSLCSFFDNESIENHTIYLGKRINRGLFKSQNRLVNADCNGAYNIIRKEVPNAFRIYGIEDTVGYPYSISVLELKI